MSILERKRTILTSAVAGLLSFVLAGPAQAVPVTYSDDGPGVCDAVVPTADHELGPSPLFPIDERIDIVVTVAGPGVVCTTNPGSGLVNTRVFMTNTSLNDWEDVWFVADDVFTSPGTLTNWDREINMAKAFRIDDVGVNTPLVGGDDGDLVFEIGETWEFLIQEWANSSTTSLCGTSPSPGFLTLGSPSDVGGASCSEFISDASIIARIHTTAPEPVTVALLGLGIVGLGFGRRRIARS